MIQFDVIFIDNTCPKPYDVQTLDTEAQGGTEATVIRVAEGLAARDYKVGVVQHNRALMSMGRNAFYLPLSMLEELDPANVVILRGIQYAEYFKSAKKFSWQHDVPTPQVYDWTPKAVEHGIQFICVSRWHAKQLDMMMGPIAPNVIYNPVPDGLFLKDKVKYDRNKMVWTASPHKGLAPALKIFKELRDEIPTLRLHVFNPGYFSEGFIQQGGVFVEGPQNCRTLWTHVKSSLCVFYPTSFSETFGLIAAEANALKTPIATMPIAALNETVSSRNQLFEDELALTSGIKEWYHGGRPNIKGQQRFKTSEVITQWESLLAGQKSTEK